MERELMQLRGKMNVARSIEEIEPICQFIYS